MENNCDNRLEISGDPENLKRLSRGRRLI